MLKKKLCLLVLTCLLVMLSCMAVAGAEDSDRYSQDAIGIIQDIMGTNEAASKQIVKNLNDLLYPENGCEHFVVDNWQQMSIYGKDFLIALGKETQQLMKQYPDAKKTDIVDNIIQTLSTSKAPTPDSATVSKVTIEKFWALSESDRAYVLDSYTLMATAVGMNKKKVVPNNAATVPTKAVSYSDAAVAIAQEFLPAGFDAEKFIKALNDYILYPHNGCRYLVADNWQMLTSAGQALLVDLGKETEHLILNYPDAKKSDIMGNIISTLSTGKSPTFGAATVTPGTVEKFKKLSVSDKAYVLSAYNTLTLVWLQIL